MQSSYNSLGGFGMVILNELGGQTKRFKLIDSKRLGKEASAVLKNIRNNYGYIL
jgi:hypothetical protein